ncbi:MAG: enoyl-CoA hydratase [Acidimicrobiales bacterium]|nr:enoyl-CoA hydratase [Acidimicrobiales bacterium]
MGDPDELVLWDLDEDGVLTLTLNRPDRMNAWTEDLGRRYFGRLDEAAADPAVRVIVLTGAGRGFCPGADMDMLSAGAARQGDLGGGDRDGGSDGARPLPPHTYARTIPKPIIAAVNGACAGLGMVHALMCDVRFAAAGAKWTTAFAQRGLIAEHGMSWILPRIVGQQRALDLLLSARVFTSEEAFEMGLVVAVYPKDELLGRVRAYAREMATKCSPASLAAMKAQVDAAWGQSVDDAVAVANRLMAVTLRGPDFVEGVTSYVEKRPPTFKPYGAGTTFSELP